MSNLADPKDIRGDIGDINLEPENVKDDAMSTRVEAVVSESNRGGGASHFPTTLQTNCSFMCSTMRLSIIQAINLPSVCIQLLENITKGPQASG
jgi:hypothetical protein